ncbi:MAG: glycosyl hydrolase [Bacteroidales bacterium]
MKKYTKSTLTLILVLSLSTLVMAQTRFKTLNYLYGISGTKILSGQHNDLKAFHGNPTGPSYWTDEVYKVTGKYPALFGVDFGFHGEASLRWAVTYEAEKQWNKGAVVNFMWHACPPTQSEPCNWDGGVKSSLTASQWTDLLTDGGALNIVWKNRIDLIAAPYLQYLEDKRVEVLWRPFHEQNQTVFWWNSGGAENTKALWKLTYDYMMNELGLTNLIWTWNVQDIHSSYQQYNPGDEYFDMAALDIYSGGFTDLSYYNALVAQAGGKPLGIGECFKVPTATVINNQPKMSFFMIWAYGLYENESGGTTNTVQQIMDTYNNPKVITLDEMPGWQSFCAYDGMVSSVPGRIEAEHFGICGEGISYSDSDTLNVPGYYRKDTGVDIDTTNAGGYCISDVVGGEWTEYPVHIDTTGTYTLEVAVASDMDDKKFHIEMNGTNITGSVDVPNTGGMQVWDTLRIPIDLLTSGPETLRLWMDTDGFSIDYMKFIMGNKSPHATITAPEDNAVYVDSSDVTISVEAGDPDGEITLVEFFNGSAKLGEVTSEPFEFIWEKVPVGQYSIAAVVTDNDGLGFVTDTVKISVRKPQGPFLGTPYAIPGKIECEDYDFGGEGVSFHELTPGNKFLVTYHGDDPVDVGPCGDEGGGFNIGDFQDGEWVNYTVNVAATGLYDIEFRYGTAMNGSSLSLSVDGDPFTGTVPTPNTNNWDSFVSIFLKGKSLTEGEHILTMHCVKGYQNVNWIRFTESVVGIDDEQADGSGVFKLHQNYPNPFTLSTTFSYQLSENCEVKLNIFDLMGKQVKNLVDREQNAGFHQIPFDAEELSPGVYIYRLESGEHIYQKQMLLMK